jgi:hypothetical protein
MVVILAMFYLISKKVVESTSIEEKKTSTKA